MHGVYILHSGTLKLKYYWNITQHIPKLTEVFSSIKFSSQWTWMWRPMSMGSEKLTIHWGELMHRLCGTFMRYSTMAAVNIKMISSCSVAPIMSLVKYRNVVSRMVPPFACWIPRHFLSQSGSWHPYFKSILDALSEQMCKHVSIFFHTFYVFTYCIQVCRSVCKHCVTLYTFGSCIVCTLV